MMHFTCDTNPFGPNTDWAQWNCATHMPYNTLNLSYDFMGFLKGGLVVWELLGWNGSNDEKKDLELKCIEIDT
jgi:hypothetical protein